jgi:integrase
MPSKNPFSEVSMAVREKINKKTGQRVHEAYWNARSKRFPHIRVQRSIECGTEGEAAKAERRLVKETTEEVARLEALGTCWRSVINGWEADAKGEDETWRNPMTGKPITEQFVRDVVNTLRNWTKPWLEIPAGELTRKHGKDALRAAEEAELSKGSLKRIKNYINMVYDYGIQEGIILNAKHSPVFGLLVNAPVSEKLPEILTVGEVRKLLFSAKVEGHSWYPIWALALTTGMRSSELYALRKKNVLVQDGLIRVCESWDHLADQAKSTKAGYWRNAPIPPALEGLIKTLLEDEQTGEFLLPRPREWAEGLQAMVLRAFCEKIGIPSIRFHAMRACFATHLLTSGVEDAVVMRIGGWRDFKTFQIYVRLAGVRERGASDRLGQVFLPSDQKVVEHLGVLYQGSVA